MTSNLLFFSASLLLFPLFVFFKKLDFGHSPKSEIPNPKLENPCSTKNTAFKEGEELVYKIYYNWGFVWLSAGEMTFRVMDADDQYHFSMTGETYTSYDWFFKVRDYYDTWVQKDNLLPIRSIRNVQEGKYTLYDDITFDQSRQTCYNEHGRSKEKLKEYNHFKIAPCMHDMLSILYYARNLEFSNLKEGAVIPIKIFVDKDTWPLQVKYKGKSPGKHVKGLGKFNTLQFSPEVIAGNVFPKGAELNVWVTDDQNRLPLIIESPLSVGSAKAVLKSYKSLRHPLTAKVGR